MKKSIFFLALCSTLLCAESKLISISDGDTMKFNGVKLSFLKTKEIHNAKCRVIGIDTPEKFESNKLNKFAKKYNLDINEIKKAGELATKYAENLFLTNSDKSLEVITLKQDFYLRELCQITIDRFDYGRKIVEDGFAVVYKKGKYIDDKKYKQDLLSAQQTAKDGRRGLWKDYFEIMETMSND